MSINLLAMIMLMAIDLGRTISVAETDAQKIEREKNIQQQNYAFSLEENKRKNSINNHNKDNKQKFFNDNRKSKTR